MSKREITITLHPGGGSISYPKDVTAIELAEAIRQLASTLDFRIRRPEVFQSDPKEIIENFKKFQQENDNNIDVNPF